MKIQPKTQYGDFLTIKKFEDERKFGCECVHCGRRKKYTKNQLLAEPVCSCQAKTVNEVLEARLTEEDLYGTEDYSMFREQVDRISEQLENQPDNAVKQFQLSNLKMLIDLIPMAEREFRNNPKQSNMYTLNGLITQCRELIADLLQEDNTQELVNNIVQNILQPRIGAIANSIIQFNYDVKRDTERNLKPERVEKTFDNIDQLTKEFGRELTGILNKIQEEIIALAG